jgi:hypothetical protein
VIAISAINRLDAVVRGNPSFGGIRDWKRPRDPLISTFTKDKVIIFHLFKSILSIILNLPCRQLTQLGMTLCASSLTRLFHVDAATSPISPFEFKSYSFRIPFNVLKSQNSLELISSPKIMLIVVWNPYGFHLVNVMPKGQKWTSQYYIDHILPEMCALRNAIDRRKLAVHADNAKPHVAKIVKPYLEVNGLRSPPHPPYSLNLAPRNFFFSAIKKECSKEHNFRQQKSFLRRWFKFRVTFHSRH